MSEEKFRVAVTAAIRNFEGQYLITKRTADKKRWPNKWTLPGGQLMSEDFVGRPTDTNSQWYHVLENCVRREVMEETKLHIKNIKYLCSLTIPDCVIVSYIADLDYPSNHPILQVEECDEHAWVNVQEAEKYDLIEGILDELKLADSNRY